MGRSCDRRGLCHRGDHLEVQEIMDDKVYIQAIKDPDGTEKYSVDVCGQHEVFQTQLEAANYADAILSIKRRKSDE